MPDLSVDQQAAPPASGVTGRYVDVVAIGDITVTSDSVLVPQGRFPLTGTTWTIQDSTRVIKRSPRYAVTLAAIFAVILVGLLFLLIKQRRYTGFVLVTVVGEGLYHSVRFPPGPESTAHVASLVNRARVLAAATV
ncbi:MAG TPA: hypothetical protein VH561_01175 [Micromonosporaceae bacterium]